MQVTPSQHTENLLFGGDCAAASVTSPLKPPKLSTVVDVVVELAWGIVREIGLAETPKSPGGLGTLIV